MLEEIKIENQTQENTDTLAPLESTGREGFNRFVLKEKNGLLVIDRFTLKTEETNYDGEELGQSSEFIQEFVEKVPEELRPVMAALGYNIGYKSSKSTSIDRYSAPVDAYANAFVDQHPDLFSWRMLDHDKGYMRLGPYLEYIAAGLMPTDKTGPDAAFHDRAEHGSFLLMPPLLSKAVQAIAVEMLHPTGSEVDGAVFRPRQEYFGDAIDGVTAEGGIVELLIAARDGEPLPEAVNYLIEAMGGDVTALTKAVREDAAQHYKNLAQLAASLTN